MSWDWIASTAEMPLLVRLFQAAALVALAVFTGFIAYRQFRVAEDKLRLDLFEKRWAILQQVLAYAGIVFVDATPTHDDTIKLWGARSTADFLFGPEIEELIGRLLRVASKIEGIDKLRADGELPEDRAVERLKLRTEFESIYKEIRPAFARYLAFRHVLL